MDKWACRLRVVSKAVIRLPKPLKQIFRIVEASARYIQIGYLLTTSYIIFNIAIIVQLPSDSQAFEGI